MRIILTFLMCLSIVASSTAVGFAHDDVGFAHNDFANSFHSSEAQLQTILGADSADGAPEGDITGWDCHSSIHSFLLSDLQSNPSPNKQNAAPPRAMSGADLSAAGPQTPPPIL